MTDGGIGQAAGVNRGTMVLFHEGRTFRKRNQAFTPVLAKDPAVGANAFHELAVAAAARCRRCPASDGQRATAVVTHTSRVDLGALGHNRHSKLPSRRCQPVVERVQAGRHVIVGVLRAAESSGVSGGAAVR